MDSQQTTEVTKKRLAMPHQIGTDEAGYGPNLGPLTVTGTLWELDDEKGDLYKSLKSVVTPGSPRNNSGQLFIADSKRVYGTSKKLAGLELPVLATLYSLTGSIPHDWLELVDMICESQVLKNIAQQVWLFDKELSLPIAADPDEIKRFGDLFSDGCKSVDVQLKQVRCSPVFPDNFNDELIKYGNKATLLSNTPLMIVRKLLDQADDDVEVGCDKHGGRSKYASLIQQILTDEFVFVGKESLEISDYSFRENERDVVLRFQAKGESFLPTALAAMYSKYLREVIMELWNDFWQRELPELKPTKGYPQDAKRFKAEIAKTQIKLGISDHEIWRNR